MKVMRYLLLAISLFFVISPVEAAKKPKTIKPKNTYNGKKNAHKVPRRPTPVHPKTVHP